MPPKPPIEFRTVEEIRAGAEEGEFTGYIAVWDAVDSYGSRFARGSFRKTIQERSAKVKVFYNHEDLVGRSLDIREDDRGVAVRGKLNLAVQKAKEVWEFIRDGTLEGLSFGFQTLRDRMVDAVREIQEVRLYEYGPVNFPANELAQITATRATEILAAIKAADAQDEPQEARATDFNETVSDNDLSARGWRLFDALQGTLSDIWWDGTIDNPGVIGALDAALSAFHAAYLEWANAYIARFATVTGDITVRSFPAANELSAALCAALESRTIEQMAAHTALTIEDLNTLRRGKTIAAREKLNDPAIPEALRVAHRRARVDAVETLCREIREGLTEMERRRVGALLRLADPPADHQAEDLQASVTFLRDFRSRLGDRDHA